MVDVSVIVPVYNVEKYLDRCLSSLVNQTLSSLEIIVINDGSTDHSQEIIDRYANQHPDIVFPVYKNNGGLGDARNFGIEKASGKYIGFIDSDDFVDPNMFEVMYQQLIKDQSDIVACDMEYYYEEDNSRNFISPGYRDLGASDAKRNLMLSQLSSCNKLFRTSLFQTLRFPTDTWYEDIPVVLSLIAKSSHVSYIEKPFYHYVQRESSILQTKSDPRLRNIFTIMDLTERYFVTLGVAKQYHDELEYLYAEHIALYGNYRFMRSSLSQELFHEGMDYIYKRYPNWRKNKYIDHIRWKDRLFLKTISNLTYPLYHWYFNR